MFRCLIPISFTLLFACQPNSSSQLTGAVRIGDQIWQDYNLNARTFQNGDTILLCTNHAEWWEAYQNEIPAMVYYDFDESPAEENGALYNIWVLHDEREIAPKGWRIPKQADIELLVGTDPLQIIKLAAAGDQSDQSGPWRYRNYTLAEKQDSLGFHAAPVGEIPNFIEAIGKIDFNGKGETVAWWTKSKEASDSTKFRFWNFYQGRHGSFHAGMEGVRYGAAGHYIRCIKE